MTEELTLCAKWQVEQAQKALLTVNYNGFGPANASGNLARSITYRETVHGYDIVATGTAARYVSTLRYGRRPGGYVPPAKIRQWIDDKHLFSGADDKKKNQIAYLIARRIQKMGNIVNRRNLSPTDIWNGLVNEEARKMLALAFKKAVLA